MTPDRYWRDVGTIDAYHQANIDLLDQAPPINLCQDDWPRRTYSGQHSPARAVPGKYGSEGIAINSVISSGAIISGVSTQHSILFNNVFVNDEAQIHDSILFEGLHTCRGAQVNRCIIDKNVTVPEGTRIGINDKEDRERFEISDNGIVVVPKGYKIN